MGMAVDCIGSNKAVGPKNSHDSIMHGHLQDNGDPRDLVKSKSKVLEDCGGIRIRGKDFGNE